MLISYVWNKLDSNQRDDKDLVWGLVVGLVWGLVWGLVVLLVNFSEAFPFLQGVIPISLVIVGVIVIAELLFWLSKKKKPKKNVFWFTCKRKLENVFEVLLGVSVISQIYVLSRGVDFSKGFPIVIRWVGIIGFTLMILGLIVGLFYLWIRLNMFKYKR